MHLKCDVLCYEVCIHFELRGMQQTYIESATVLSKLLLKNLIVII